MKFLNNKVIRIAGIASSALSILLLVLLFMTPGIIFSAATMFYILHWLIILVGAAIVGILIAKCVSLKTKPSKFGIIYFVAQGVSLFTGLFWINKLFYGLCQIASFYNDYSGYFGGGSSYGYGSYGMISGLGSLLENLGSNLGSVGAGATWLIMIGLFFISNIVALVIMILSTKNPLIIGDVSGAVSNSNNANRNSNVFEKLKLTDAEGKVIYMTKADAGGMDLSKYTVETVHLNEDGTEVYNNAAENNFEAGVKTSGGAQENIFNINTVTPSKPKGPSFFSTKKGKLTIGGIVVGVIAIIAGAIIIPKLLVDEVDLTANLKVEYSGFDGKGRISDVSVDTSKEKDAEKAYFLRSVRFDYIRSDSLKNGDEITVSVSYYPEETAKRLGYKVVGLEKKIKVEGLEKILLDKKNIDDKLLDKLKKYADEKANEWKEYSVFDDVTDYTATFLEAHFTANKKDMSNEAIFIYKAEGTRNEEKTARLLIVKFRDLSDKANVEKAYNGTSYEYIYKDDNNEEGIKKEIADYFKSYSNKDKKFEKIK